MTTWAEVQVGDVVAGTNDSMWAVTSLDDVSSGRVVTLKNCSSGREASSTVPADKDVDILILGATAEAAAVALVQVHLGGQPLARKNESGLYMTPDVIVHTGAMLSHLYVFHGGTRLHDDGSKTISELTAEHHAMHQRTVGISVPHVHDPDWLRGRVPV